MNYLWLEANATNVDILLAVCRDAAPVVDGLVMDVPDEATYWRFVVEQDLPVVPGVTLTDYSIPEWLLRISHVVPQVLLDCEGWFKTQGVGGTASKLDLPRFVAEVAKLRSGVIVWPSDCSYARYTRTIWDALLAAGVELCMFDGRYDRPATWVDAPDTAIRVLCMDQADHWTAEQIVAANFQTDANRFYYPGVKYAAEFVRSLIAAAGVT